MLHRTSHANADERDRPWVVHGGLPRRSSIQGAVSLGPRPRRRDGLPWKTASEHHGLPRKAALEGRLGRGRGGRRTAAQRTGARGAKRGALGTRCVKSGAPGKRSARRFPGRTSRAWLATDPRPACERFSRNGDPGDPHTHRCHSDGWPSRAEYRSRDSATRRLGWKERLGDSETGSTGFNGPAARKLGGSAARRE